MKSLHNILRWSLAVLLAWPMLCPAQISDNQFKFLQGSGTKSDPYVIDSFDALVEFRERVALGTPDMYPEVVFTQDIDLGDDPNWASIGQEGTEYVTIVTKGQYAYFYGHVDGNGHTISNLTVNKYIDATSSASVYLGLFGRTNGSQFYSIENLNLTGVNINIEMDAGARQKQKVYAGGLVGFAESRLYNITVDGNITVSDKADEEYNDDKEINLGGVAGKASEHMHEYGSSNPQLERLNADINITSNGLGSRIGGIVGRADTTNMQWCTSSGMLKGRVVEPAYPGYANSWNIHVGGICGYFSGIVYTYLTGLSSVARVSGGCNAGGLIGYAELPRTSKSNNLFLRKCYAAGAVSDAYYYSGGLIGRANGIPTDECPITFDLLDCYYAGTVTVRSTGERGALIGSCQLGTTHRYVMSNCFYDKKMVTDDTDYLPLLTYLDPEGNIDTNVTSDDLYKYVQALETEDILEDGSYFSIMVDEDEWEFSDTRYPQLNAIKQTPVSTLAVVPVHFKEGEDADRVYEGMTLEDVDCNGDMAAWSAPVGNAVVNANELMSLHVGYEILTLTSGTTAKRLDLYMGYDDVVWEGEDHVPTGLKDEVFGKGNGTYRNPYVIMNAGQLAYALKNNTKNEYYKLGNDIVINKNLLDNPTAGIPWIDTKAAVYSWDASLDGDGRLVRGMYLPQQSTTDKSHYHGLLGKITSTATVKDMGVVENYITDDFTGITSESYIGAIAGSVENGAVVDNCFASGTILTPGQGGLLYAGGICGKASGTLSNCMSAMYVMSTQRDVMAGNNQLGGIAGKADGATFASCLSIGRVSHDTDSNNPSDGGICPGSNYTATNCYYDLQATACSESATTGVKGVTTAELTNGSLMAGLEKWTVGEDLYPVLKTFESRNYIKMARLPMTIREGESVAGLKHIMSLPLNGISWQTVSGNSVNALLEYGLLEPAGQGTVKLLARYTTDNIDYAYMTQYISVADDFVEGIEFVDANARQACVESYGSNGVITLSQAAEVTDFTKFINNAATKDIVKFPEMRYFVGISRLTNQLDGCSSLEEVELPLGLTSIAAKAFAGCSSLQSVTMPANLNTVEPYAFRGSQINQILVSVENDNFISRDGVLFSKGEYIVAYPPKREGDTYMYTEPINGIYTGAFVDIDELEVLYIGDDEGNYIDLRRDAIPVDMQVFVNDATNNMDYIGTYASDDTRDWPDLDSEDNLHRYYPLKVTSAKYATTCIYFNTELPEGLTAYYCYEDNQEEHKLIFRSIGRLVPAGLPVLIRANEAGVYPLVEYEDWIDEPEDNFARFQGSGEHGFIVGDQSESSGTNMGSILTLGRNSQGEIGFFVYQNATNKIPAYRAYFVVETLSANAYSLVLEDQTGITRLEGNISQMDEAVYDLAGRKVADGLVNSRLPRGIYIQNGKKIIIK